MFNFFMEHLRSQIIELKRMVNKDPSSYRIGNKCEEIQDSCKKLARKYVLAPASEVGILLRKIDSLTMKISQPGITDHFISPEHENEKKKVKMDTVDEMIKAINKIGQILGLEFKDFES